MRKLLTTLVLMCFFAIAFFVATGAPLQHLKLPTQTKGVFSGNNSDSPAQPAEQSVQTVTDDSQFEIALTIDDLPAVGALSNQETRKDIMDRMISTLQRHNVKDVFGFAIGAPLETAPDLEELISAWVDAGFRIGNHTYSHKSLHKIGSEDYIADIERIEPSLEKWAGATAWRYFRYPFLEEGKDAEQYSEVRQYLESNNYQVAEVTLDFHDWQWNDAWVRCTNNDNETAKTWIRSTYLNALVYSFRSSVDVSMARWGRPVKLILLIHVNSVSSALLEDVITTLRKQSARFIPLEDAMSDPIYKEKSEADTGPPSFQYDWYLKYSNYARLHTFVVPEKELGEICR